MDDVPQPASDSYSVGDRVQIYIDPDDPDVQYHGVVCEIIEILSDDLDAETGRATDAYSYVLRDVEANEVIPISFRHRDLVPAEHDQ